MAPHLICGVAVGLVELATWWVMDVAAAVAVLGAVGLLAGVCTIPTLLVASMALPAGARPPQGPAIACIKGVARR